MKCLFRHNWKLNEKDKEGVTFSGFTGIEQYNFIGDWYVCTKCLDTKIINKRIIGAND